MKVSMMMAARVCAVFGTITMVPSNSPYDCATCSPRNELDSRYQCRVLLMSLGFRSPDAAGLVSLL